MQFGTLRVCVLNAGLRSRDSSREYNFLLLRNRFVDDVRKALDSDGKVKQRTLIDRFNETSIYFIIFAAINTNSNA